MVYRSPLLNEYSGVAEPPNPLYETTPIPLMGAAYSENGDQWKTIKKIIKEKPIGLGDRKRGLMHEV